MNTTAMAAKRYDSRPPAVERSAVETAIRLLHQPALMRNVIKSDIPSDVLVLLKVSGGETDLAENLGLQHNINASDVVTAAKLYLQCILTNAGTNDRRMLCLPASAKVEDIREHKKWLLKWLHPDRNRDSWESALFLRVNAAFLRLQTSSRANAEASDSTPVPSRRRQSNGRSRSKPAAYVKLGSTGLIGHAAKPILLMVGILMLTCAALLALAVHWPKLKVIVSSFAF